MLHAAKLVAAVACLSSMLSWVFCATEQSHIRIHRQ